MPAPAKDNQAMQVSPRPLLLVLSSPSGGGKTTLCQSLLKISPNMRYSISCTTRAPRGDECNGRAYHFISVAEFQERLERGEFIEHATVHGHLYGTLRAQLENTLRAGHDILLDIDVQGARALREATRRLPPEDIVRRAYVDIFIEPPSGEVLARRLRERRQDDEAVIARRLANAKEEMAARTEYRYRIVNDDLDQAMDAIRSIVIAEHHHFTEDV